MSEQIRKKIEKLRRQIREYDYLYYVLSRPKISDKEYDDLLRELVTLEEKNPVYKSGDSPTARVGGGVLEGFPTVQHRQKMLSLDNTYSFQELKSWDERVRKGLPRESGLQYVVEHKIDGVSANLTYERGSFEVGATRGDGQVGEDVTANLKTVRTIPLVLLGQEIPEVIEVRGEVYMDRTEFRALNKEREQEGSVIFANPRNATSGSLKLLDTAAVAKRGLHFFAHSLGDYRGKALLTQWEFLQSLKKWGFVVNPHSKLCKNFDEVLSYCSHWQEKRDSLPYDMDGIVVKVNDLAFQSQLGFTHRSPRWASAYKFPARQATTEVIAIHVNVGRTGVITPTAELAPVECAGVVIRNATLHNFDEIRRLGISVGDRVLIERAGDVIPKIVQVVEHRGKKAFQIPLTCPACSGKVVKEKEEDVAYRCINVSCPAQLERELIHFASRQAMDIEGMGESVVRQLVSLRMVRTISDIYMLRESDFLRLELFKEKKARNLVGAIAKSKEQPLARLLFALGIRHVGEKASYVLAQRYQSLQKLMSANLEELDSIPEVGAVMATAIHTYFAQSSTKALVKYLARAGVNCTEAPIAARGTALAGKRIVFTGELKSYSRLEATDAARRAGGEVSSEVSKRTDYVVAGENPGSKSDRAKKLGVAIINEQTFKEMIR